MIERGRITDRIRTTAGVLCVLATLLLMSTGVRTVRAEAGEDALISVDPILEAKLAAAPDASPAAPSAAPAIPAALPRPALAAPERPGTPSSEVQPGIIVFNTRGYNYGPAQGAIEPEAMRYEAPPARRAP